MPTPAEQAAEESVAGSQGVAAAAAGPTQDPGTPQESNPSSSNPSPNPNPELKPPTESAELADPATPTEPEPDPKPEPELEPSAGSAVPGKPAAPTEPETAGDPPGSQPNRAATTSLIAGILGVTGIGALVGLAFGAIGLARSRSVHTGKVRAWIGIILSLLWVGAFVYVAPHIIKAADPGCTAFKEKVLPHYNQAIEDLDTRAMSNKTTADLATAVAGLASAAAKSKNAQAKKALGALTRQLRTASNDQIAGQIPASVMVTLNQDAVAADNACGTI